MKKILLVVAASMLFAAPAMAGYISSTKHNLGSTGTAGSFTTGTTNQICVFCHTPHNSEAQKPLWNRGTSAVTATYESPTLNNKVEMSYLTGNDAVAPLCLSCHDGATGLGAGIKQTFGNTNLAGWNTAITGGAQLGTQLDNDHPVGMKYDPSIDTNTAVNGLNNTPSYAKLRVSNGFNYVDCSSCHEPHGTTGQAKFTRTTMDGSALCLDCHNK